MSYLRTTEKKGTEREYECEWECDLDLFGAIHPHQNWMVILIRKLNKWCFTVVNDSGLPIKRIPLCVCVWIHFPIFNGFVHYKFTSCYRELSISITPLHINIILHLISFALIAFFLFFFAIFSLSCSSSRFFFALWYVHARSKYTLVHALFSIITLFREKKTFPLLFMWTLMPSSLTFTRDKYMHCTHPMGSVTSYGILICIVSNKSSTFRPLPDPRLFHNLEFAYWISLIVQKKILRIRTMYLDFFLEIWVCLDSGTQVWSI